MPFLTVRFTDRSCVASEFVQNIVSYRVHHQGDHSVDFRGGARGRDSLLPSVERGGIPNSGPANMIVCHGCHRVGNNPRVRSYHPDMGKIGTRSDPRRDRALTDRQREVMSLMVRGYTNGQIAEAMGISLDGAKFHVSEILSRLGVSTREEAVTVWQDESGMIASIRRIVFASSGWASPLLKTVAIGIAGLTVTVGVAAIIWVSAHSDGGPTSLPTAVSTATDFKPVSETRVQRYLPASDVPAGELTVQCFTHSLATPREDAWRCSAGQRIADPCFALTTTSVVCDSNPAVDRSGTKYEVSEPPSLTVGTSDTQTVPWALLLADGSTCQRMTGARGNIAGKATTFQCTDRSWLLGEPAAGVPWLVEKVTAAAGPGSVPNSIPVATAWR